MASPVWLFLLPLLCGRSLSPCLADVLSPCLGLQEINPKRFTNVAGRTIQLKLGSSDRLTHQLTTHVFSIFLTEVLGYNDVVIENIDQTNTTAMFSNLSKHSDSETPSYMIDLEVWIPPDLNIIHFLEMYDVKECGNIGPPGRFGWFVPTSLVNKLKRKDILQWDIFSKSQTAKIFALPVDEYDYVLKFTRDNRTLKYFCSDAKCKGSVFIPPQCTRETCATLLATNSDEAGFVIKDIMGLNLFVRVVWVGNNLPWLLTWLTNRLPDRLIVFLGRTPGPLALSVNHTAISFPVCDPFDNLTVCSYSSMRMVKLAWSKLADAATPAYESLQKVEFSVHDYRELIQSYILTSGTNKIYDVACSWLKRHKNASDQNSWKHWMPSNDDRKTLVIGGIFPLKSGLYAATGIAISAVMAVEDVNNHKGILRDYRLDLKLNDGQCQSDIVMKTFIDYILHQYKKLVGILGPACSETVEPLAGVSKHYNSVVISYSAEGSSFNDRKKYPYFFRTIGENKQYKYVYLELFRRLKWKRVASLTEDGTKYTEYISLTQDLLQKNGIVFVANRKFPQDWEPSTFQQYLAEFKEKNARIIIADINDDAAKAVMCQAYKMNMTARQGFVWFLPLWLSPWWEVTNKPSNHTNNNRTIDCTEEQIKEAINGHLSMSHAFFAGDSWTTETNESVGNWRKRYEKKMAAYKNEPSIYAGYAYDAVWTYAYALDLLLKENASHVSSLRSANTTKRFVEIIQNTNFSGVSGQIYFRDGPSRPITVNVFQWLDSKKYEVGTYYPNYTVGSKEISGGHYVETREIKWLNADGLKPPWDGTPSNDCYIDGFARLLNTSCQVAIIVANIIGIGMLVLLLVVSFLIIKHRYDKKVQLTQKYMKSLGIDLLSVSAMGSLDKWEIAKDRVVINRKLGEGAFGTVYGGEAYFEEKGWVAVAVKTLKVGSTTEEKLDFLSEAEVMKRFEHKNIVQLMGVCTKNEPVYTIMEFMLYGDLKTFLLARRHLVGERSSDDSDEISNKKLTSMALDVARALSYLAELKYVHRDVASRNCLINANRVVKLGDFGMTRPTFENDYYKFNRKGMLPVRWMAPESLVLGVFTPASDVWSFGVLLYETITFGSFPFQGMSNNQVLEYVKAGNTLNVPNGVKPQLEELIQKCWHKDYKKRPPAAEIVEFLANNSRLISPCIDVPLSSVQMEDAVHFDAPLALADVKTRKFSMTLRQRTPTTPTSEINIWREVATEPLLPVTGRYIPNTSIVEEPFEHHHVDSLL